MDSIRVEDRTFDFEEVLEDNSSIFASEFKRFVSTTSRFSLTIPPMNRRHHFSLDLPFFLHLVSSHIIHKCISNKNYGAWRHNMGYIGKTQNKSGRLKFFRSTYRITSLDYYSFFRFKKYLF